jgi:hypothetical protein
MNHVTITVTTALLTCLALLVPIRSVAVSQTDPDKSQQSGSKKTEEKKADAKRIEVHVKVSAQDGEPLPPKTLLEISGKEKACGSLNSTDATAMIDEKGEATFNLPVCKVTVKINVALYIPAIKQVDLASYKSPIVLTLEPEE